MTGVTQRMLTKTLRAMERDGLVNRREFGEIPPRVEYELTPLGMELLIRIPPSGRGLSKTLRISARRGVISTVRMIKSLYGKYPRRHH
jgi:DNA-binding PadR family transcriptional regulator